ncbi:hypothetical protein [Microseira wollei]|uniref:hypothetical protein n=1 Tax=Microseira wollei TaxID=467598 RepID=UPI001CFDC717|nr:hypothetical protein [Microseira wollei]
MATISGAGRMPTPQSEKNSCGVGVGARPSPGVKVMGAILSDVLLPITHYPLPINSSC